MKFVFSLIAALLPAIVQAGDLPPPPSPALAAKAYVLYDYTSNQVLLASNTAHNHLAPGSLTKLMTAYLAFDAIRQRQFDPDLKIYPSLAAVGIPGEEPSMLLDHNQPATVDDLLHGLAIQSGNDAARALAELINSNRIAFAGKMNSVAQGLGMHDTHFVNTTGKADPKQYCSAYDEALLVTAILRDFPEQYKMFGMREYKYADVNLINSNRLLWDDPHIDGLVAGHTEGAQFNAAISALRSDWRLIAIVLGADSKITRDRASQELLNYGYRNFENVRMYRDNQPVARLRVWKGVDHEIAVGFPHGLSITLPRGTLLKFKASMVSQKPVVAPVTAGQRLGTLKLTLSGKPYAEYPLVALKNVPLTNVFSRGWDNIRMMFK